MALNLFEIGLNTKSTINHDMQCREKKDIKPIYSVKSNKCATSLLSTYWTASNHQLIKFSPREKRIQNEKLAHVYLFAL